MTVAETLKDCLVEAGAVFDQRANASVHHFGDPRAEYDALIDGVALAHLSDRTQIELTGSDRSTFLHNLCTNDVRKLETGAGCEAFLCDVQGKILHYVYVFVGTDSLVLETVPGQAESLIAHLDRYLIREDVQFHDRSRDWNEMLMGGPESAGLLTQLTSITLPQKRLQCRDIELTSQTVSCRQVDWVGPVGFLLSCDDRDAAPVWRKLVDAGARPCGREAIETARVESGTPCFGQDVTKANLPQEVGRDRQAISFTKGCYLGQETVARIDALGHVNRMLVGLLFDEPKVPPPGMELSDDGKTVGQVTSATFSFRHDAPLALAYVRREKSAAGTELQSPRGKATVITLGA